jgi:DNA polymerase III epsilon subunit-like protein
MTAKVPFHHRTLDPVTLFTRPCDKELPNLSECAKRAGIDFKGTGYHTAVSDAVMVIELLRAGWTAKKEFSYDYSTSK